MAMKVKSLIILKDFTKDGNTYLILKLKNWKQDKG